jgi:antitoxin VapB
MGTQLNIKGARARSLAERIAQVTGESITDAVTNALDQRLRGLEKEQRQLELGRLLKGSRARWKPELIDTAHGDLLYDENGLPG